MLYKLKHGEDLVELKKKNKNLADFSSKLSIEAGMDILIVMSDQSR
jgi:hypothetical protein